MKVASSSFLISISRRELVAQIRGKPIYSISEVALIPLSSQLDAEKAIVRARDSQRRHNEQELEDASSDSEFERHSEDERDDISLPDEASPTSPLPGESSASKPSPHKRGTSIARDVIQQKGIYGRFTQKWFSKGGWTAENRRKEGIRSEDGLSSASVDEQPAAVIPAPSESQETLSTELVKDVADMPDAGGKSTIPNEPPHEIGSAILKEPETENIPLLPKLLTVAKFFFGSKSFYFSYDYDLSRSIANQPNPSSSNPLHRTFDPMVSFLFPSSHLTELLKIPWEADDYITSSSGTTISYLRSLRLGSQVSCYR